MLMWSMGRGELARGAHWMLLALMWAPAQLSGCRGTSTSLGAGEECDLFLG